MQLIFETESETHTSISKMALIDKDSINEKFQDNIVEKLSSISNGNKENIEKNDKLSTGANGIVDIPKKEQVNGIESNSEKESFAPQESSHNVETNLTESEDISCYQIQTGTDLKPSEKDNEDCPVKEEQIENGTDQPSDDSKTNDLKENALPINNSSSVTESEDKINQPQKEVENSLDENKKDEKLSETQDSSTEVKVSDEEDTVKTLESNLCDDNSKANEDNTLNNITEVMDVDQNVDKAESEVHVDEDCVELDKEENKIDNGQVINTIPGKVNGLSTDEDIPESLKGKDTEHKDHLSSENTTENGNSDNKDIVNSVKCDNNDVIIKDKKNDDNYDVCEIDINTNSDKEELIAEDVSSSPLNKTETQQNLGAEENKPEKSSKLTLDILSDDEDTPIEDNNKSKNSSETNNQSINIEDDDDDIMLIDDTSSKGKDEPKLDTTDLNIEPVGDEGSKKEDNCTVLEDKPEEKMDTTTLDSKDSPCNNETTDVKTMDEEIKKDETEEAQSPKPLLPKNFVSTCKKNLAEMTRNDLEEFCILKIVESVLDRGNLGEIKTQLKKMARTIEEYKNKAKALTKQNHALQVVLKSVQEELRKNPNGPITPLKISRSVGIQVLMADTPNSKNKRKSTNSNNSQGNNSASPNQVNKTARGPPPLIARSPKPDIVGQQIPVPRLVPANPGVKCNTSSPNQTPNKPVPASSPATKTSPMKRPVKRPSGVKMNSDTVDLTDDEPPPKVVAKGNNQSVRVVPSQSLMAPQRASIAAVMNHPRQVYIPISGGQAQNVRAGQTLMFRTINAQNIRPRNASMNNRRTSISTHPAPLPEISKQCQPPNWKLIPPAPEIKLSKVENGIVISWKLDNYREEHHESIASYQIYAYQETSSAPNTNLWKKIGDVKALPLPMACTLTQFISGYKYYFAVRAVDSRSRIGPFSTPGNIMLVNK